MTTKNEKPDETDKPELTGEEGKGSIPARLARITNKFSQISVAKTGKHQKGFMFVEADVLFGMLSSAIAEEKLALYGKVTSLFPVGDGMLVQNARCWQATYEYCWVSDTDPIPNPDCWQSSIQVFNIYSPESTSALETRVRKYFLRGQFLLQTGEGDLDNDTSAESVDMWTPDALAVAAGKRQDGDIDWFNQEARFMIEYEAPKELRTLLIELGARKNLRFDKSKACFRVWKPQGKEDEQAVNKDEGNTGAA